MPDHSTIHGSHQITVCILFFEKVNQTIECIQSFLPANVPIVVCNNGSSQASRQTLADFISKHSSIKLIEAPKNLGVSGGRNFIIHNTKTEWLFFVDNDITIITTNWLKKLLEHFASHPEVEAFIPRLYNVFEHTYSPRHNILIQDNYVSFTQRATSGTLNMFPGGASIIRRTLFDRLGVYDEQMFVNYEDYELCLRGIVTDQPAKARAIEDITLRHDHRQVTSDADRGYVAVRYNEQRTKSSAQRILDKYHLYVKEDSSRWSETQRHNLLHGRIWWSKETLFIFIPAWAKKIWNDRL